MARVASAGAVGRRWIAAAGFFALLLQALFAPAIATPPPVNLLLQLSAGSVPPGVAAAWSGNALVPATSPATVQAHHGSDVPFCPYWCGVSTDVHLAGLAPALAIAERETPPRQAGAPLRSLDAPSSPAPAELNRARGPPAAA